MPAPAHRRVTFSGVFGPVSQPVEVWQFNVSFAPEASVTQTQNTSENIADARRAFATHLAPQYSTDVTLTRVREALVGDDGKVQRLASGAFNQQDDTTAVAGTLTSSGTTRMPLQTAMVVSLGSARPGAIGKGRFFLPWPAIGLDTDYRIGAAAATAWAGRARDFLEALTSAVHARPVIASGGSAVEGVGPALYPVTSLRVGRVPDTMRSRRSHMLEGYAQVSLDTTDNVEI
jgi:hypothetical protein